MKNTALAKGVSIAVLAALVSGCVGLFNLEPYADTVADTDGKTLIADTDRNWSDWREAIDLHLRDELAGYSPDGGYESWDVFWAGVFRALRKFRQNPERYVDYIVSTRRNAGLPELAPETADDRH